MGRRKRITRCIICNCGTVLLDVTGRCGSCAAVLEAKERKISYGKMMAQKLADCLTEETAGRTKAEYKYRKEPKPCKHCGEYYIPRNGKQRYCSNYCYRAANRSKSPYIPYAGDAIIAKCDECGKEYKKSGNHQKYCKECSRIVDNRKHRERVLARKAAQREREGTP